VAGDPKQKNSPPTQAQVKEPARLSDRLYSAEELKAAQRAWADYLNVPVSYEEDLGGGVNLELVLVPPGTFWMGSTRAEQDHVTTTYFDGKRPSWLDSETQHRVTLTKPFYLGRYEVTQEQYAVVMNGENPSYFSAKGDGKDKVKGIDTRRFPVENV